MNILSRHFLRWALFGAALSLLHPAGLSRGEPPQALPSKAIESLASISLKTTQFDVTCFAVMAGGDTLALGSDDGNIRLWSLRDNRLLRTIDTDKNAYIGGVSFSPDGKKLAYHADDLPVRVLDLESGEVIATCKEEIAVIDQLTFSPDGKLVGIVTDPEGFVWNLESGKTKKFEQPVRSLAFSPDGKKLALGFNTLRLIEVATDKEIREMGKIDGRVTSLSYSSDGTRLLAVDSGCPGTSVRLFEIDSGYETVLGEKIRYERVGAAFSAGGDLIAINDGYSQLSLWDSATGERLQSLATFHRDANAILFTADDRRLLTGRNDSRGDLQVWDVNALLQVGSNASK